ncbi:hypothetical protein V0288_02530 [Pannus brasiliensis CCIBt3594]|uniref:SPOR domain-containing protein n=1 Tax=Pannus brasiliensis CCIBt3594 TaxID=1427578 RepID=A0AAW9QRR6_9CHRO
MKITNRALFSGMPWVKIAIFLVVTSSVAIDRILAGETRLPSPPALKKPAARAIDPKPAVSPSPRSREYVFQAPPSVRPATVTDSRTLPIKPPTRVISKRTPPTDRSDSARRGIVSDRLFLVRVSASSTEALARIQKIEPFAYIRPDENAIDAGIFQQQNQADRRVRELASIGFSAKVVTRSGD